MIPTTQALGAFVRSMRERAPPPASDHPNRRRTSGLRREELAASCGISTTWLTWIEQGRTVAVSATALSRLASALHLSRAERAYLFAIAGRRDPAPAATGHPDVPPSLLACLRSIQSPAYLLDALCEARGWNGPAEDLFTGWLDRADPAGGHNLLRFLFQSSEARVLLADWPERSRRVIAEFRADTASLLDDPAVGRLVAELRAASAAFGKAWDAQDVLGREGGVRLFQHPMHGTIRLEQQVFAASAVPGLKLVILTPPQDAPMRP